MGTAFLLANYLPLAHLGPLEQQNQKTENNTVPKVLHIAKPDYVRGIYLTAASAGRDEYRKNIIKQMEGGYINSVVIDIKDYSGYILYDSQVAEVNKIKGKKIRLDAKKVIDDFHQAGVYVIARQTVFQDPILATARPELAFHTKDGQIWKDNKGLAWLDPSNEKVWEYNLAIAKEAVLLGFDEINFDYMRYPSDGPMASLDYNLAPEQKKYEVMKNFYKYLSKNLAGQTPISVDMFGLVMDNVKDNYDLNIGQRLIDALDYFDDICPMMYASHYPKTYLGFNNSAEHPGEVVAYGLKIAQATTTNRRAKIRPWLQAFSLGAVYDQEKIKAQIRAVEAATSTSGWLFWNARNVYADYIFTK